MVRESKLARTGSNTQVVTDRSRTTLVDGTIAESEIWCDASVLQPAYRRGDTFQSVFARLESEAVFQEFKDALTTDPRLDVMVEREEDYYAGQSRMITGSSRVSER